MGQPIQHIFIPVLAGILVNEAGEIFLARRKAHLKHGGKWEFPGGKLNPHEQPAECLARELQEEFGVPARVYHPFEISSYSTAEFTIVLIAYWAQFVDTPRQSTDHDTFRWVAVQDLLTYDLTPADVYIARKLQSVSIPTFSN